MSIQSRRTLRKQWLSRLIVVGTSVASLVFGQACLAQAPTIELEAWKQTTGFQGPRTSMGGAISGNRIYILGGLHSAGSSFTLYDDVQFASLGNDGAISSSGWQRTEPFATARSGPGVVVVDNTVYIVGGYSMQGTLNDVQYARINADGTLGKWSKSPNSLSVPRSNHRLELHVAPSGTKYLAAVAGVGEIGSDTVHFGSIEVAPLGADGSVGAWKLCPFQLKGGRSAPATAVVRGHLYVLGGWGDHLTEDVFSDIQMGRIRDDGCTEPWLTNPYSLTAPSYGLTATIVPNALADGVIVLGGNMGQGNYLNAVQTALIGSSVISSRLMLDTHQFATGRWGHLSFRYGDFIYVVGGAQRSGDGYLSDVQFTRVRMK